MADIVAIARSWIGTPYLHQASSRGIGTDCLGLIRGIWREIHGGEPEQVPIYTPDWSEVGGQEVLLAGASRHLLPTDMMLAPGDVLLFRMRPNSVAKHLGVCAVAGESPSFVHAYDRHGVVESPLSAPWRGKIVRRFRFP